MSTTTLIAAFTSGFGSMTDVLDSTLGIAIGFVMGLAALFFIVKWIIGKTQGRRK